MRDCWSQAEHRVTLKQLQCTGTTAPPLKLRDQIAPCHQGSYCLKLSGAKELWLDIQRRRTPLFTVQIATGTHPEYEAEMLAATTAETGSLARYVRRTSQNRYGWIRWIVMNNLPLTFCENANARQ
ncbi:hypothetical protein PHYPSEUDO_005611 [Phytophthora pseudosyringae]|uniref:Uncharacterized protein n=1 Tax=Phytophthora pseudosyringae TaxID=221518 RepID=A0A8T1VNP5_9STRA|nr:hypothetical protein PHYPSEUDO_005611 [Phytophthora pseudosyringae]